MVEVWELVDKCKNKIGILHKRGEEDTIPFDMYHLVVEIWVKTKGNKILLTQRHPEKNYGLMWECSGGSVIAGEESPDAAVRELFEETGIVADKKAIKYLGTAIKSNYIVDTYLYVMEEEKMELHLQKEEVVNATWVDLGEMDKKKECIVSEVWERYCEYKKKIYRIQRK